MRNEPFDSLTSEQIEERINIRLGINYGLGIMFLLIVLAASFVVIVQGKIVMVSLFVIPVALLPILMINVKQVRLLRTELIKKK